MTSDGLCAAPGTGGVRLSTHLPAPRRYLLPGRWGVQIFVGSLEGKHPLPPPLSLACSSSAAPPRGAAPKRRIACGLFGGLYVCWTAYLLRYHGKGGPVEPVPLPGAPFSHYYAQEVSDEGIIMETGVSVKEVREPGCPYLTEKGQLRVQVEWEECYLLFQATYHKYDDVCRIHNYQMRREIIALQAENYSLERQLFSYQKSIAYAHSRGAYSDELATPDGREDDDEEPYYEERAYSLGDRSLSTDTEYA
ncbi:uncharacterized protein LOC126273365 [Schistocerca gregaria]|uniref:uncharacterized protein LOC126273365 n=1 Tax=Schistocerca gregaria TaxID=7010 RepID=UPI00211F315A|nr:uncharacterized protein LOC126273365 [Schistocerca gregaria]